MDSKALFIMVTVPILVIFLCSIKHVMLLKAEWRQTRIPAILPHDTVTLEKAHFQGKAKLEVTSPCELECHKRAPLPTYEDLKEYLSFETLYLNGSRTLTSVNIYSFNSVNLLNKQHYSSGRRTKRQVFGLDGRFSILAKNFLLNYPFSTSVKISTGCTGILVAEKHVLTAAHCIHDGKNYVKGAQRLKVGFLKQKQKATNQTNSIFPEKPRLHWIRVKRTHVPKGWIKGSANEIGMDYDYALLELKRPHKKPFMKIGVTPPRGRMPGGRIHFSGFDNDRPGDLVYRFCLVKDETYDLLYQHCDAQPGASGSGVYIRMWKRQSRKWERKVIGIFSGHQWVDKNGMQQDYNVAVRITPLKYAQICFWIKGNYVDCRDG
ncbi:serine protease 23-like isoform X2 [Chiloscyllium punctatum]|uniref:serine protease 23-like isoform X2 n=1 Tax=Chiloscyllium punctatum TaxID=137246 RepID=UPI003B63F925